MARQLEKSMLLRLGNRLDIPRFPSPTKEEIRRITQIVDMRSVKKLLETYFDVDSPQREIAARELERIVMKEQIPDSFRKELVEFVWDRGNRLNNPDKARERVGLSDLASSN